MGILPKDIDILPPYDDRLFKAMLTKPEAKPALLFLAPQIVKRPVVNVLVRNTELPVDDINEKVERFDMNCAIDDDSQADIEMQGSRMQEEKESNHENLRARSIYNLCDLHSSQPSRGRSYDKLIRTYQVMFCNFPVYSNKPDFINSFSMRHDKDGELLHDAIYVVFIDLTRLDEVLRKPVGEMTGMEKFSVFLKYASDQDYRDIVNKIIESEEGLAVAGEVLMNISKDERERAIFRNRRIALADRESDMITSARIGKAEGLAEGLAKGLAKGRTEGLAKCRTEGRTEGILTIARNAMKMNMAFDDIFKLTGLTRAEIESLRDVE